MCQRLWTFVTKHNGVDIYWSPVNRRFIADTKVEGKLTPPSATNILKLKCLLDGTLTDPLWD